MNPIQKLRDWLEWRRRDRERHFVGSWTATTVWEHDGASTGRVDQHIVEFYRDGNGARWSEVDSTCDEAADMHLGVHAARHNWRRLGTVPEDTQYPRAARSASIHVIHGGKSGDAA